MISQVAVKTFAIDKTHSEVAFQVRHLITKVRGRFSDFSGQIELDLENPAQSRVDVTIQAASIDTNTPDRDAHLRSNDFFGVEQFPTLRFVSTAVRTTGSNTYAVTGDFTIRDITRSIEVPVTYLGEATDPWGNKKIAFEAEFTVNRKDYGLLWNAALETGGFLVGDEVTILLSFQAAAA
ncbi:MAG: YceI family protein [Vicinamibacterales bacterium]